MGYSYYDTPEGEDCFLKLWYTGKLAAYAGVVFSTYDVLLYTRPKGYFQTIARIGYVMVPFVGMAAAFTSTVCMATSLRKKDDRLNYFLGGAAAAGIFGAWSKSAYNGFRLVPILGLAAVVKKMSVEDGWEFFPGTREARSHGQIYYANHDLTIMRDTTRPDLMWSRKE